MRLRVIAKFGCVVTEYEIADCEEDENQKNERQGLGADGLYASEGRVPLLLSLAVIHLDVA